MPRQAAENGDGSPWRSCVIVHLALAPGASAKPSHVEISQLNRPPRSGSGQHGQSSRPGALAQRLVPFGRDPHAEIPTAQDRWPGLANSSPNGKVMRRSYLKIALALTDHACGPSWRSTPVRCAIASTAAASPHPCWPRPVRWAEANGGLARATSSSSLNEGAIRRGVWQGGRERNKGRPAGSACRKAFPGLKHRTLIKRREVVFLWLGPGVRGEAFPADSYIAEHPPPPVAPTMSTSLW